MPVQMQQWTEYLLCPVCRNMFSNTEHRPISLACGHTICKMCLGKLKQKKCPFDDNTISRDIDKLPVNLALLQLVGAALPDTQTEASTDNLAENAFYNSCKKYVEELAIFLKAETNGAGAASTALLSRPMQRKLVALVSCQLVEEEGRTRAMRAVRSLGERAVTELILQHQNQQQLSANLWAAVRARGCQFLGPAMQEEVLKLILLALEDGSALSRKVLVLFVVQRLEAQYPQASKTAIGHVVQLLYRASCFKVTKRHEESSLMQLKEEIRTYEALRREHDAQIIQIATEAGLRISPEQWSSLLYGDTGHKSQMQSIIDKLQTPQSFSQSVQELIVTLQRIGDPGNLTRLESHLDLLSNIDPSPESPPPSWENLDAVLKAVKTVVQALVDYIQHCNVHKLESGPVQNTKYKTSLCRDFVQKGNCPRGTSCTFAHSQEELERYRVRHRKPQKKAFMDPVTKTPAQQHHETQPAVKLLSQQQSPDAKPLMKEETAPATKSIIPEKSRLEEVTPSMPDEELVHTAAQSCNFTIPVAKAMPMSQKLHQMKQMIYTSPTVARADPPPEVIPIARRANVVCTKIHLDRQQLMGMTVLPRNSGISTTSYRGSIAYGLQPAGSSSQTVTQGISPTRSVHVLSESPYYNTPPGDPPIPINAIQAGAISAIQQRQQQFRSGSSSSLVPRNPLAALQLESDGQLAGTDDHAESLLPPRNPFTGDLYRRQLDTETYGQVSEASHLEVLHRRKNELMHQLNKTKHLVLNPRSETMKVSCSSQQDNGMLSSSLCSSSVTMSSMSLGSFMSSVCEPCAPVSVDVLDNQAVLHLPQSVVNSMVMFHIGQPDALPTAELIDKNVELPEDAYLPWVEKEFVTFTDPVSKNVLPDSDEQDASGGFDVAPVISAQPLESEQIGVTLEDDDEFIPFQEHATVSKYGPISRLAHVSRTRNTGPFQPTHQPQVLPVTAVTPIQRPYPISVEVPSQFSANSALERVTPDHQKDPSGYDIAASLPTALIQPSLIKSGVSSSLLVSGLPSESDTMWNLKEKMLNMPVSSRPASTSSTGETQICNELAELTRQIAHLEMSEHDRLSKELQAIKMRIHEAERQKQMNKEKSQEQATEKPEF